MVDAPGSSTAPSARGVLATTPLAHALVFVRNKRLTGTLLLRTPSGDRTGAITTWRGRISEVKTTPNTAYFGAVAHELGLIDVGTLDATLLEVAKTKKRHGEILVARGSMTPAARDQVLVEQACRKVHDLFSYPDDATFEFYDGLPSTEEPPLQLDPLAPVWRGIHERPPKQFVREVLSRLGNAPLAVVTEDALQRMRLPPDDDATAALLAARPMTLRELRTASRQPIARVDLLVWLLVVAKCVEPTSGQAAPSVGSMRTAPPAGSRPPADRPSAPGGSIGPPSSGRLPPAPESARSLPVAPLSGRIPTAPPSAGRLPTAPESGRILASSPPSARIPSAPPFDRLSPIPSSERSPLLQATPTRISTSSLPAQSPLVQPTPGRISSSSLRAAQPASGPVPIAATLGPADLGPSGIAARAATIDGEDLYGVLGLSPGASTDAIRAAFIRLAKLWHPDRLPADLAAFNREAEKITSALSHAHQVLTDPGARAKYTAERATGPVQRSRGDLMKEILAALSRSDFATVERIARELAERDTDDAEAMALEAWASCRGGEADESTARAALVKLEKAVNTNNLCERALYYRGMVHKRLGAQQAAYRDFTRVVELEPKHVDAQREIRIFEMRTRKRSGEHLLDGLFNKRSTKK